MISEPTLLLDEEICKENIYRMASKAKEHNLVFKPHMKTHQSRHIGAWLKDAGAEAITVSSIKMARYFANAGWKNITIAFPVNINRVKTLDELASETELTLLVNNSRAVQALEYSLDNSVKAYIEIDTGSNRTGLDSTPTDDIEALIKEMKGTNRIEWCGFYSHPGHSYDARSPSEIRHIHNSVIEQFQKLRDALAGTYGEFEICIGDTPCCSAGDNFDGIDAISPGNFVFYDLMQERIGSCEISDIAVALACPVVDKYPSRNQLVIHGGAVHFSKEKIESEEQSFFGKAVEHDGTQWNRINPELYLTALSQEHGTVTAETGTIEAYEIGDILTFIPVHSCLTANLIRRYTLTSGRTVEQMPLSYS